MFFDDVVVKHTTGALLEEKAYYPFGGKIEAISDRAFNKLAAVQGYNGGVDFEEETGYYNTFYRQYDAQIGRFTGVDVLAESQAGFSPYQFGYNNPAVYNDPLGDLPGIPKTYMDHNGNKWHSPGALHGTSLAWLEYDWRSNSVSSNSWWGVDGGGPGQSYTLNAKDATGIKVRYIDGQWKFQKIGGWSWKDNGFVRFNSDGDEVRQIDEMVSISYPWERFHPQKEVQGTGSIPVLGFMNNALDMSTGWAEFAYDKHTLGLFNSIPLKMKVYPSGWRGNQHVSTFNISKASKGLGVVTFGFGIVLDGIGVYNYYEYGAKSPNAVHPVEASVNTGVGVYGLLGGPPGWMISSVYFVGNAAIPGGWSAAMESNARNIENNRQIIPNWSARPMGGL